MKILLLSCYELGHQPMGLVAPRSLLVAEGHEVRTRDLSLTPLHEEDVNWAELIGVSVPMLTATRLGVEAVVTIRQRRRDLPVIYYGLYASLNEAYLVGDGGGDYVVGGEYLGPLIDLIRDLDGPVPAGVTTRVAAADPFIGKGPSAIPDRADIPHLCNYSQLIHGERRIDAGYTEASRGCVHRCLHCPITPVYQGRIQIVPADIVLEDIRRQVAAGAGHITFGDPDFLNGVKHSLRIIEAMHAEFPQVTFDFTAKIEHLLRYREDLSRFRDAGLLFVISAVESVADEVLENLDKGHTRADVVEALELCAEMGITMRPSLLPFTPWTSAGDIADLLAFVEAHDLVHCIDPVQYGIRLLLPPGSSLLGRSQMQPFVADYDAENFTWNWDHPDPAMDRLQQEIALEAEKATEADTPIGVTFRLLQRLANRAAGIRAPPVEDVPQPAGLPPRMSESWFCCAEPTKKQRSVLTLINS